MPDFPSSRLDPLLPDLPLEDPLDPHESELDEHGFPQSPDDDEPPLLPDLPLPEPLFPDFPLDPEPHDDESDSHPPMKRRRDTVRKY